jgi:hypothetical protein
MPHAIHNRRLKELWTARGEAANGFWQKVLPEGHVRQLVFEGKAENKTVKAKKISTFR